MMALRKLILCPLNLCQTFKPASDENGCWGECARCGKRAGYVTREQLRRFADAEERKALEGGNG